MSMGDRDATTAAATSDCRARPGGVASVDDDDVNDDDADEDASSSHNDSQYSEESSRTLSNTSCQSEEPLPVGGGSSNSAVASATHRYSRVWTFLVLLRLRYHFLNRLARTRLHSA